MPIHQENTELLAHLQRINKQLGNGVIGIEVGEELPMQVRVDRQRLAQNFSVRGLENPIAIQKLFERQADGIRQLLEVAELAKEDRSAVQRELFYTQVLLWLVNAILKLTRVVAE